METSATRESSALRHRRGPSMRMSGVLIGLGLGGFVDGIVIHQILQWHHMLSDRFPPTGVDWLQLNVMADGFFHVATWLLVAAGIVSLWSAVGSGRPWTWRSLGGWALVGWGVFNLVEGVVDHHLLQLHRVRPGASNPLVWDIGFLVLGAVLVGGGWALQRRDR